MRIGKFSSFVLMAVLIGSILLSLPAVHAGGGPNVNINVDSVPEGAGYIYVNGTAITTLKNYNWAIGKWYNLTAVPYIVATPGQVRYRFDHWDDIGAKGTGGTDNLDLYVVPAGDSWVTATYVEQFYFNVTSTNNLGNPTGGGWYDDGRNILSTITTPVVFPTIKYYTDGYIGTGDMNSWTAINITQTGTPAIHQYTTCAWYFVNIYRYDVTSSHGLVTGSTSGWYAANNPITSSIPPSVKINGILYDAIGWTGTGSIPSGTGNDIGTVPITAPTTLNWVWSGGSSISISIINVAIVLSSLLGLVGLIVGIKIVEGISNDETQDLKMPMMVILILIVAIVVLIQFANIFQSWGF